MTTNKALSTNKAFFAFSNSQVEEGKVLYNLSNDVELVNMGAGLICPKNNAKQLEIDMAASREKSIQDDKSERGAIEIIKRELYNYECQITGSPKAAKEALSDYGFSDEEFVKAWKSFWEECVENDSF